MIHWIRRAAALATLLQSLCTAQTFIPEPHDVVFKESSVLIGASLSYKETDICDTTPGVKSYSGYVTLPVGDTYNASIFFWYFESRTNADQAPTTIWMPGGPGTSFLGGGSGFPCSVNADGNGTTLNPWSLNSQVNMLYVDIPVQTGFSYTEVQNGTFDVVSGLFTPGTEADVVRNSTTTAATMSSQDESRTANTTLQVARQMFQLSQVWFQEFPEWNTNNKEIDLWSYSYSGFFGPASVAYIQQQNERIANGSYETTDGIEAPISLSLGTLGTNNGCIDVESQLSSFPAMMFNNTYGIKVVPDEYYDELAEVVDECYGLIQSCRDAAAELDPYGTGAVDDVNALCVNATENCFTGLEEMYLSSNRSVFDLALPMPGDFPIIGTVAAFYNQRWVQEALGVPVNFTESAEASAVNMFGVTGDPMIQTYSTLEYILEAGIGIAFVYGDRDYQCNWMGVENVSLSMNYPGAESFRSAGYAPITTNASYQGGLVRQHDRVSFSRVFEAGHAVADYQPETVLRIFERAVLGRDVATGEIDVLGGYSTRGPLSTLNVTNAVLPPVVAAPQCGWYLASDPSSCTDEQRAALQAGTAVVVDWEIVSPAGVFYATSGNPTTVSATETATAVVRR
ncbi:putative carboxypeptidase S1 [Cryphonectria parasitica EP155]|uniref:Carboxypeptidase S1 n=1 Tax=Cryphonectria parasitica (strain ATCC 38755 / EP155) TaxID=660469 RepID=A0A9P4XUB2_CRYP1|nr:putative carboxypeptidase S1 [Cryphonectria parasitica EP155]KAF3760885.1 putative carboxypeptidase S1 [Cryphonectria parasitica EP155]